MQVSARQIELCVRLKVQEPDLVQLLKDLRDHVHNQVESVATTEELLSKRGEARMLSYLINLIDQSRESSERLEQYRKRGSEIPNGF